DLTIDAFIKAFRDKTNEMNRPTTNMLANTDYQRLIDELTKQFSVIYAAFIEKVVRAGSLWVLRTASGNYRFSIEANFKECTERREKQIPTLIANTPRQLGIPVQSNM